MWKPYWIRRILTAVLLAVLALPAVSAADPASPLELQCVADQRAVDKGGHVGMHILYHYVSNKSMSKAWVKVKVPDSLDIVDTAGAVWEADKGTLTWNLKDLNNNGADVIHFNLKVKADAAAGEAQVACTGGMDGGLAVQSPAIEIRLGTEIDQPVFNGYPDGGFHPASNLTRAETAAIVSRLAGLPEAKTPYIYNDVPASHWAYSYVQKVTAAGYMNGSGGAFRPDDPISRGEFIVLMLRVRGITPYPLNGFSDTKGHWGQLAAGTAKALRYVDGIGGDKANLDSAIEREAAAKLLCIMFLRGQLTDGAIAVIQHWPDVPKSRWSFGWVEELSMVAHESSSQEPFVERLIRYLPDRTQPF
ncbi:hypothetical protein SD70_10490 [Gordoniibacillus kamchatkensis]|uniref:SLH domain-containing protein n=1 Tax=Gordoniibacillus kamchatkensis TaxID=1590651 RepID=A0ABR5AKH6_9BACL|nr:S-layer homology domain-containing protein [Paenibacillus sp. VKM B-2647]KIL40857.1 hypothetical protein SD70_10490 [Paenibacillus sp. VKM B-2647]